jgi:hypothetical protein
MFLHQARATRLMSACFLFMVVLVMAPRADISETPFDEANTPINEVIIEKAASSWEERQSVVALVPRMFAQQGMTSVRRIFPVYVGRLRTRTFRNSSVFLY